MERPSRPRLTTVNPMTAPPVKATRRAVSRPSLSAAWVVRTLASVATTIPPQPAAAERRAPAAKQPAKYDAQESAAEGQSDPQGSATSSQRSDSKTSSNASVESSAGSSGTGPSAFSGSGTAVTGGSGVNTSTGTASSDSKVRKLEEIRAEVEQLVERVVPEEKDNIDEMMTQFRGREEELVETLRSMQEREVAQKARLESQKQAKRDARETVSSKQATAMAVDNTGTPADDSWMQEIENTPSDDAKPAAKDSAVQPRGVADGRLGIDQLKPPSGSSTDTEVEAIQQSLQQAIEAEDWEKVASAANGLSLLDGGERRESGTSGGSSNDASDKSQKMDSLVEKGDWDGVVAVASKYADESADESTSSLEERKIRRQQRLQEEQEAIQQAGIWSGIAAQTKTEAATSESETNKAATVAADWAIARSLSELKAADKAGELKDSESEEDTAEGKKGDDEGTI